MNHNYPYLKDLEFLKNFDKEKIKEQFVKIIVLTFDEKPIQQVEGKVLSGNITIDGSSAMRRTANLSILADEETNNLTSVNNLFSINKKVQILIGFTNNTGKYTDFPVLWFPQGIYVILNPSISHDTNGVTISLTLHDKMALLNGECGGILPASTVFHEIQQTDENGNIEIIQPTIYQIIQELVNHFGGEQLGKIIISDVDNKIKQVMKWTGSTPLYLYTKILENGTNYNSFSTNFAQLEKRRKDKGGTIKPFTYGDDVGYILTDFVYPQELISNAGDTITSILDQIKETLGNYEYFYDIDGNFRFQEIKNYLNKSYSTFLIDQLNQNNYLVNYADGKVKYSFEDADIITAFSNTPQYQQIKNDFVVWGKRTTMEGLDVPIRYHLAIDQKPQIGNVYKVVFYVDSEDNLKKAKKPICRENRQAFPLKGQFGKFYLAEDTNIIYKWNPSLKNYEITDYQLKQVTATDFRTQLYLAGVESDALGLSNNYYYTELKNEWPKLYDIENSKFFEDTKNQPSEIDFFLDFIDSEAAIAEFSVENIGRRTLIINDDSINCLFEPNHSNLVLIESGTDETEEKRQECEERQQDYVLVRTEIYSLLVIGGFLRSAYERIRSELYQYTNYNEQVSLTALPIYYLEPNTIIEIRDTESNIFGNYEITNISLPLDINGTMTLSCNKALERI